MIALVRADPQEPTGEARFRCDNIRSDCLKTTVAGSQVVSVHAIRVLELLLGLLTELKAKVGTAIAMRVNLPMIRFKFP